VGDPTGARQAPISMYMDRLTSCDSVTSGGSVTGRFEVFAASRLDSQGYSRLFLLVTNKGFGAITSFRHPGTAPNQALRQGYHL
jgi:hypothetical protein